MKRFIVLLFISLSSLSALATIITYDNFFFYNEIMVCFVDGDKKTWYQYSHPEKIKCAFNASQIWDCQADGVVRIRCKNIGGWINGEKINCYSAISTIINEICMLGYTPTRRGGTTTNAYVEYPAEYIEHISIY